MIAPHFLLHFFPLTALSALLVGLSSNFISFDPRLSSIQARAQYFDEGNKTYKTSEAVNFELKFYSNYDLNL